MQIAILSVITFITAAAIAYYNVYISSKFHTLFFLMYARWQLILYSLIYGSLGVVLLFLLKDDVLHISNDSTRIKEQYLKAFATGISVKAIADLNLFNVRSGGSSFPIGIKTFTKPLDQFFERKFNDIGFERSEKYLKPFYDKYAGQVTDINVFKEKIVSRLRRFYPDQDQVGAFIISDAFDKAKAPDEVMRLVLNEFGYKVFERIFSDLNG